MDRVNRSRGLIPRRAVSVAAVAIIALVASVLATSAGATHSTHSRSLSTVVFESTQLTPVDEQQSFLNVILKGAPSSVNFIPASSVNDMVNQLNSDQQSGSGKVDLVAAAVGDIASVSNDLIDLSDVAAALKNAGIPQSLWTQAKLGTSKQLSIPWMQATYLMAANKKALPYLPKGANVNALSWGQFDQWAKNLKQHFGQPEVGFPAGPTGLFPRFLEGYLIPSFSGALVTKFQGPQALSGWLYLKNLWRYVNPQSTTYNFMQDPLLSGEVLVAWDHVARLTAAMQQQPSNFVIFPAPAGPKGRGFLPVLASIGVPKTSQNQPAAKQLIEFLDGISPQAKTISTEGFFPVIGGKLSLKLGPGLLKIASGVAG